MMSRARGGGGAWEARATRIIRNESHLADTVVVGKGKDRDDDDDAAAEEKEEEWMRMPPRIVLLPKPEKEEEEDKVDALEQLATTSSWLQPGKGKPLTTRSCCTTERMNGK